MNVRMVCNVNKCRKPLATEAWITSCSHIFCKSHGKDELLKPKGSVKCPACNSQLGNKFDVVFSDLNPSEAYRSVILSGLEPHIVMDITLRAISFWYYQIGEDIAYHENVVKRSKETINSMEEEHSVMVHKYRAELENALEKIKTIEDQIKEQTELGQERAFALEETNRQIQRMMYELNRQKRKSLIPAENLDESIENNNTKIDSPLSEFNFQPHCLSSVTRNDKSKKFKLF